MEGARASDRYRQVPEEQLGVVILTNKHACLLPWAPLIFKAIDTFIDAPRRDWSAEYLAIAQIEEQAPSEEP